MEKTIEQHHKELFEYQEKAVRLKSPEFTEQQIHDRCQELQRQIIEAESKWHNPKLAAIWSKRNENKSRKTY